MPRDLHDSYQAPQATPHRLVSGAHDVLDTLQHDAAGELEDTRAPAALRSDLRSAVDAPPPPRPRTRRDRRQAEGVPEANRVVGERVRRRGAGRRPIRVQRLRAAAPRPATEAQRGARTAALARGVVGRHRVLGLPGFSESRVISGCLHVDSYLWWT